MPWPEHELLAGVEVQGVPVVLLAPALAHRVEAEGRLALGRELGEEAGLAQLLGHPGGVLGDLGQRDVGLGGDQAGAGGLGLQAAQPPDVGPERHEAEVRLVAEQGHRDHLVAVRLGGAHRLAQGVRVERRAPAGRRGGGPPSRSSGSEATPSV